MKKLFVAFLMVVSLPVAASMVGASRQASAFVTLAGHSTAGGGYCDGPPCEHFPRAMAAKKGDGQGGDVLLALALVVLALRLTLK